MGSIVRRMFRSPLTRGVSQILTPNILLEKILQYIAIIFYIIFKNQKYIIIIILKVVAIILQYIAKIAPYMCMILVVLVKYFQLKAKVNTYKLLTKLINILKKCFNIHRNLLYPLSILLKVHYLTSTYYYSIIITRTFKFNLTYSTLVVLAVYQ